MRVLVLGGGGMLGHVVARDLPSSLDIWTTDRGKSGLVSRHTGIPAERVISSFDARDRDSLAQAVAVSQPDWVVNCIGLIKQAPEVSNQHLLEELNIVLPRTLGRMASSGSFRLLHISTDCVFSGQKGSPYTELDTPDAQDPYGRTKALGEMEVGADSVIVRTSCVGPEIQRSLGLLEWLLTQPPGPVRGFRHAMWSGLPTVTLADALSTFITHPEVLSGTYHVASNAIDKASLLRIISEQLGSRWNVIDVDEPRLDRSLDASKVRSDIGLDSGTWPQLAQDLVSDLRSIGRC